MTMLISSASASSASFYTPSTPNGTVGVAAAMAAIKANARTKVSISDTSANLEKNFDALNKLANNITQVTQSDPAVALSLSGTQLQKGTALLGKIGTDYRLHVSAVTASNAVKVAANARVASVSVTDSSANVSSQLNALNSNTKLARVNLSTPATNLTLTAAQMGTHTGLLDKMGTSFGLAVSQATSAQAVSYAGDLRIKSVAILDSTAGISENLDALKNLGLRLKEIRTTANQPALQVSAEQVSQGALVIGKIYSSYQLAVYNATTVQAQALAANRKVVSIDVVDTATNVAKNLKLLDRISIDLKSVHITDLIDPETESAKPLNISSSEFAAYGGVLGKIDSSYTLAVRGANVNEAQAMSADERVTSIAVTDSSASISSTLDALRANAKVVSIAQTGKPVALAMTAAQLASSASTLDKLQGSYTLNVSGVSAANALGLATANARITALSVNDSASAITGQLTDLSALGKKLTTVTQNDAGTPLSLSAKDWTLHIGALSKIKGGYSVAISGVSAASAEKFVADSRVRSVAVSDTSAAIASKLDVLHSLGAQLTQITQSDSGPVAVTAGQRLSYGQTLDKLGDSYTLAVRGALVKEAQTLQDDSHVASIAVSDTTASVAASLDALQDNAKLSAITLLDKGQALALNVEQLTRDAGALSKIQGNYSMSLSGVAAADALAQAQNSKVSALSVSDTGEGIVANLADLARLGSKLGSIRDTSSSPLLNMAVDQWSTYGGVLGKLEGGFRVNLSGVSATQASTVALDERVQSMAISDSTAAIASQLGRLQAMGPQITTIAQTDPTQALSITLAQRSASAGALAKLDEGYTLSLREVTAEQAQSLVDDERVASIAISDTSANIAERLDALQDNTKITRLTQTGTATPLQITAAQMSRNAAVLEKISGNYSLALSQVEAGNAQALAENAKVSSLAVRDSAANVVANLSELKAAGKKLSSLSQSGTPELLNMEHSEWSTYQGTLGKFSEGYEVALSGVNAASASKVAANVHVRSFSVTDTAARISASLDALQSAGPSLTAITLSNPSSLIRLSAVQMQRNADALAKIEGEVHLAVSAVSAADAQSLAERSDVDSVAVSDSSDNIASQLDALQANTKLTAITQTGALLPMAVTAAQVSLNADALSKINGAYTLDVRDATTEQATALQANSQVVSLDIADSSSHVGAAMATLAGMDKLGSISLTEDDAPITLSQSQLDDWRDTLGKIQNTYRLAVTGVSTANIERLSADERISAMEVGGTSQEIAESFDELVSLGSTLTQVTLSTPSTAIAISQSQWQAGAAVLAKLPQAHPLNLTEVSAQDATGLSTQAQVQGVSVLDTASNIAANFDELLALGDALESVMVSDDSDVLVTPDQFEASTSLQAKFLGEHNIEILA